MVNSVLNGGKLGLAVHVGMGALTASPPAGMITGARALAGHLKRRPASAPPPAYNQRPSQVGQARPMTVSKALDQGSLAQNGQSGVGHERPSTAGHSVPNGGTACVTAQQSGHPLQRPSAP